MDINRYIDALDWNKEPYGLYEPIAYALRGGGKRLRPMLALLACDLCGGQQQEVLPAALALEVFHNFTLLHDDVMDNASVRRSRPSVNAQFGDNTAILSGDQMLIEAYKLIAQVRIDKQAQTLSYFNEMATGVCEGQQLDMDFEKMPLTAVTQEEYINMIRLKTSFLLAYALKIGALIGEATKEQQEAIFAFGIHLGLAFQIQDDLLDVYGDEATFGKAIGGDICEGKKTFVFLSARDNADDTTRPSLFEAMTLPHTTLGQRKEKVARVTSLYNRVHARERAEAAIAEHTTQALKQLENFPNCEAKQTLISLAEQLVTRQS
ncbi:MAG: polyprenyl synthetase family protein [Paludibacteraceae bacterium]|nr:polyprenyl synthetase family protein [Paludibacteraceae bacterium]